MTSMSAIKVAVLGATLSLSALVAAPALAQQGMTAPAVAGTHQVHTQQAGPQGPGTAATKKVTPKKKAAPKKTAAKKSVKKPAKKPTKMAKRGNKAMPDKHHGSPTHRTSAAAPKMSAKHQSPHRG